MVGAVNVEVESKRKRLDPVCNGAMDSVHRVLIAKSGRYEQIVSDSEASATHEFILLINKSKDYTQDSPLCMLLGRLNEEFESKELHVLKAGLALKSLKGAFDYLKQPVGSVGNGQNQWQHEAMELAAKVLACVYKSFGNDSMKVDAAYELIMDAKPFIPSYNPPYEIVLDEAKRPVLEALLPEYRKREVMRLLLKE